MEIIKTYKEHFPAMRLIGKRYTDADRVDGGFGARWVEWHQNGWDALNESAGGEKLTVFFENYNCPRYTTPDEKGNVILDYGFYLAQGWIKSCLTT